MTTDEREELNRLQCVLAVCSTWSAQNVRRLVELERMDAAEKAKCILCEVEATQDAAEATKADLFAWAWKHAAHRAEQKWNAQADQYNQWRDLGEDERDALIAAELKP